MEIELTHFIDSLSTAVDYVEGEVIRIAPYHGRRVAVLANRMAASEGLSPEEIYGMTQAALLHDCAIAEYLKDESKDLKSDFQEDVLGAHCIAGEDMVMALPFYADAKDTVLYHHERADGTGAFGKTEAEVPLRAQLVHMADLADVRFSLYSMDETKFRELREWVRENRGSLFSDRCAELFENSIDYQLLESITGENCKKVLLELTPEKYVDIPVPLLRKMSLLFARVTDYKSPFTRRHSIGIAEKAREMGLYEGCSGDEAEELYIAGALHDIGKLLIRNDILEKPGKLTSDEYQVIQNHVAGTWDLLKDVKGLEQITQWAVRHHEKLDGSGYPLGLKAEELDRNDRLLACLDIYQALVEERPYKAGLPHDEAIGILRKMGDAGQLDREIIDRIDGCFAAEVRGNNGPERNETAAGPIGNVSCGWKCPVCGYVFDGEKLPEDFICPNCEQPGTIFEKI